MKGLILTPLPTLISILPGKTSDLESLWRVMTELTLILPCHDSHQPSAYCQEYLDWKLMAVPTLLLSCHPPISPLPGIFWLEVYLWRFSSALSALISPLPWKIWLEIHSWVNPYSDLSAFISILQENSGWKSMTDYTLLDLSSINQGKLWSKSLGWLRLPWSPIPSYYHWKTLV